MRRDDPQMKASLDRQYWGLETLYRLHRIPMPNSPPETTASRAPQWCPKCGLGFTPHDLADHLAHDHQEVAT